jgi:hypothetical protein
MFWVLFDYALGLHLAMRITMVDVRPVLMYVGCVPPFDPHLDINLMDLYVVRW